MSKKCRFIRSNEYLRSKFHAGVSRSDVAIKMGVPRNVVSQWISETDPRPVPLDKVVAMAIACSGVKVEELLVLRLSEELGPAEIEVLWAMKVLIQHPDPDTAFDACAILARASFDAEEQLARMVEEEAYYESIGTRDVRELYATDQATNGDGVDAEGKP